MVTKPDHQRAEEVFHAAYDLPDAERRAFVEAACGDDTALCDYVLRLLAAEPVSLGAVLPDVGLTAVHPTGAVPPGSTADSAYVSNETIGRYRLLQPIGEGGCGIVYLAEQAEPIRRRVALKLIKPGMDSRQVITRFEQERQALAVMDHPNIAQVLDAGTTDRGLPYFVMEYIPGEPITKYCDRHNLTIRARLGVFIAVCDAVQHAHMKGVIHRDIKPSNVLVVAGNGEPIVKVIDFGIAKALSHTTAYATIFTEMGQLIGTPEYMSPEQADAGRTDIDTRTDVYSLGVLLYELLAGATPFDSKSLREAGLVAIQQVIREVYPPRPSTRFSALGEEATGIVQSRRTSRGELQRELARELDWIPLKAMRKDRAERYRTPSDLADDVRCYLAGLPLEAGPESVAYRLRKYARRHRASLAAAATIVLLLIGGIAGTTAFAVRAMAETRRAEQAEADAEQRARALETVAAFQASQLADIETALMGVRLRGNIVDKRRATLEARGMDQADVEEALAELSSSLEGVNFTDVALETLDESIFVRAMTAIENDFADQPQVKARLLQTVAETLQALGLLDRAETSQAAALDIRRRTLGDEHPDTLSSISGMGDLLQLRGQLSDARARFHEALQGQRRVLGDEHPDTLATLDRMGSLHMRLGEFHEAEQNLRQALEGRRRALGNEHPDTLHSIGNMGMLFTMQDRSAEGEAYYSEALEGFRSILGNEHRSTLDAINRMGDLHIRQRAFDAAEPYLREVLETSRRVLGNEHPRTLASINNMGVVLRGQGKFAEAEPYLRDALKGARRSLGDGHPDTLIAMLNMLRLLRDMQRFPEAEAIGLECEQWRYDRFDDVGRSTRAVHRLLAALYDAWHAEEPDGGYDAKAAAQRAKDREARGPDAGPAR